MKPKNSSKPFLPGVPRRIVETERPLADGSGRVTGLLQHLRHRHIFRLQRVSLIAANARVARVLAGHEGRTRRRADSGTGIALRETNAVRRQLVDVRCLNFLLPVATDIAVAQIVRENENDVRRTRWNCSRIAASLSGERHNRQNHHHE